MEEDQNSLGRKVWEGRVNQLFGSSSTILVHDNWHNQVLVLTIAFVLVLPFFRSGTSLAQAREISFLKK